MPRQLARGRVCPGPLVQVTPLLLVPSPQGSPRGRVQDPQGDGDHTACLHVPARSGQGLIWLVVGHAWPPWLGAATTTRSRLWISISSGPRLPEVEHVEGHFDHLVHSETSQARGQGTEQLSRLVGCSSRLHFQSACLPPVVSWQCTLLVLTPLPHP